jgi:hypothetical protein
MVLYKWSVVGLVGWVEMFFLIGCTSVESEIRVRCGVDRVYAEQNKKNVDSTYAEQKTKDAGQPYHCPLL